jgi:hypothetical protein
MAQMLAMQENGKFPQSIRFNSTNLVVPVPALTGKVHRFIVRDTRDSRAVAIVREATVTNASVFLFLYHVGRSLIHEYEILQNIVIPTTNTLPHQIKSPQTIPIPSICSSSISRAKLLLRLYPCVLGPLILKPAHP